MRSLPRVVKFVETQLPGAGAEVMGMSCGVGTNAGCQSHNTVDDVLDAAEVHV